MYLNLQVNARKNGELFESYFLLHYTVLEERPFIIGLQVDGSKVDDPTAYLHSTIENLSALLLAFYGFRGNFVSFI